MKFDVPGVVMNKLFENGYQEQILDIVEFFEQDNKRATSDIPLSPLTMKESNDQIILSTKVYNEYQKMLEKIIDSKTSEEIPFILLGHKKHQESGNIILFEDIFYCTNETKSDIQVTINPEEFLTFAKSNRYKVLSIGHTHGNVSSTTKDASLVRNLDKEIIDKYELRDIGLNVSISDIWQHEAFKCLNPNKNKDIYQTIIMYNGDIIILNPTGITKTSDICAILENDNFIELKTQTNKYQKSHSSNKL